MQKSAHSLEKNRRILARTNSGYKLNQATSHHHSPFPFSLPFPSMTLRQPFSQPSSKTSTPNLSIAFSLALVLNPSCSDSSSSKILFNSFAKLSFVPSAKNPVGPPEEGIRISNKGPADLCARVIKPAAYNSKQRECQSIQGERDKERVYT